MNPNANHTVSLTSILQTLRDHWDLIIQMVSREIIGRYKGSFIGVLWLFLHPIMMLFVYTFVFSVVFQARWVDSVPESKTQFAFIMFVGMLIHGLFADVVNKAPNLILSNINYVKKVVFPLEILCIINLFEGFFHALMAFIVLIISLCVFNHSLSWTIIFFPLVLIPYLFFIVGVSWIIASLGVFIRDIGQAVSVLTTVLLFLSPVFYSKNALPKNFQRWMDLNPLTFVIEQSRNVLIWEKSPDWGVLLVYTLGSIAVMWIGYIWFQKTRKGFADVL